MPFRKQAILDPVLDASADLASLCRRDPVQPSENKVIRDCGIHVTRVKKEESRGGTPETPRGEWSFSAALRHQPVGVFPIHLACFRRPVCVGQYPRMAAFSAVPIFSTKCVDLTKTCDMFTSCHYRKPSMPHSRSVGGSKVGQYHGCPQSIGWRRVATAAPSNVKGPILHHV